MGRLSARSSWMLRRRSTTTSSERRRRSTRTMLLPKRRLLRMPLLRRRSSLRSLAHTHMAHMVLLALSAMATVMLMATLHTTTGDSAMATLTDLAASTKRSVLGLRGVGSGIVSKLRACLLLQRPQQTSIWVHYGNILDP